MSIFTDGFGTIMASLEGGGDGGSTVIPDGGELSGTLNGNLVCAGDVSITDALTVNGSLLVQGTLTNSVGAEVVVKGDLFAKVVAFDRFNKTLPQSNFSVDGDFIFTQMSFRQCGGSAALLRVGGDLIGAEGFVGSILNGSGEDDGTPGLNILVYGNLSVTNVDVSGGNKETGNAGYGGQVTVYGDCFTWYGLDASGGDSTDGDAGYGGHVDVYGNLSAKYQGVLVQGGDATNGNAANGGQIEVEGDVAGASLYVDGGNCTSNNNNHRAGSGGTITVSGSITYSETIRLNGGSRSGTLTSGNTLTPPDAGNLNVSGSVTASDIFLNGGQVYTQDFAPHVGGIGGYTQIGGSLTVGDDFEANGGYVTIGNGGQGGQLNVEGSVSVEDDFELRGGNSNLGSGGNGGSAYLYGDANLDEVRLYGGGGYNGNGGNGAYLFVKGNLTVNEWYDGYGGYCDSTNETHYAGSGGSISVDGEFNFRADDDNIDLSGGNRDGNTLVASTGNPTANGGNINVRGDFISLDTVNLRGGSVNTSYPNAVGGYGGNLAVEGSLLVSDQIYLNGGNSVGNNGGRGGTLMVHGPASVYAAYTHGGNTSNSSVGEDAGTAGCGGDMTFRAGVVAETLSLMDGTGGTAPTDFVSLMVSGNVTVSVVDMPNRANSRFLRYMWTSTPVVMRVNNMPNKQTLNLPDGTPTNELGEILGNSLFFTNTDGTWYAVAGVTV